MRLVNAALLVVAVLFRRVMRAYDPPARVQVAVVGGAATASTPADTLELLCWNIGYAGLGREADFVADGGRHVRPGSRALVERNLEAIVARLRTEAPDVVLVQELSRDCFLTRGVDVLAGVRDALDDYASVFSPSIRVVGLSLVGNLELGQGTFVRGDVAGAVRHALSSPRLPMGVTLQHFNVLESGLRSVDGDAGWVLFNVQLPAFDDGSVRRRQLGEVLALLQTEYEAGRHVVAGGDWNLRLVPTAFPYSTAQKNTWWLRDLPAELTPPGWRWAADPSAPTNRTLEQPYRPGVNYTSVIDGFLVSPNVEVVEVETLDLGFANSDHNPVRVRVRAS